MKPQRMTVGDVTEIIGGLRVRIFGNPAPTSIRLRSDHPLAVGDRVWLVEIDPGIWVSMGPVFTTVDYFPDPIDPIQDPADVTAEDDDGDGVIDVFISTQDDEGDVTKRKIPGLFDPDGEDDAPIVDLSGSVRIVGRLVVGSTIEAETSFSDGRGGGPESLAYEWTVGTRTAEGRTLVLVPSDEG